jgi:hypothetical protein
LDAAAGEKLRGGRSLDAVLDAVRHGAALPVACARGAARRCEAARGLPDL